MAEPKKDDKKGGGKGGDKKTAAPTTKIEVEIFFFLFIAIIVFLVVIPTVSGFFGYHMTSSGLSAWWASFTYGVGRFFSAFVSVMIFTSVFLSLLFILGIFYAKFRLGQLAALKIAAERASGSAAMQSTHFSMIDVVGMGNLPGAATAEPQQNPRWKEIERHMESSNQSDWRLAILEADIMLYDMLDQMGYQGDSIGEKLKQVEPASFTTLDDAWRAHKVRNDIAHGGSSFEMSRSDADRAISLYKKVFREFYYV